MSLAGSVPDRDYGLMRRGALDEAANTNYELTDAEYASNEVEDTWVDHLLGVLVAVLQWLQPLLTPSNYDALVASLLQKASPGIVPQHAHDVFAHVLHSCAKLAANRFSGLVDQHPLSGRGL